jgi:hypothetical protein
MREITDRGAHVKDLYEITRAAFEAGRDPRGEEDESAAMDWLQFIMHESFTPQFDAPAEELTRLQRYLVAASLACTEAGDLPDD